MADYCGNYGGYFWRVGRASVEEVYGARFQIRGGYAAVRARGAMKFPLLFLE